MQIMQTANEQNIASTPMKRGSTRGLLALNALLLIILAAMTYGASALAQARGRGEYTMVAGGLPNVDGDGIYIVDVANQEMIIMAYNQQTKTLDGVAYRNLAADASNAARNRSGRPGN